jgi:hypothetical protein
MRTANADPRRPNLVFVSHATEDQALATEVCQKLEESGIACWIAPRDIVAGAPWSEAIVNAIERGRVMVVVLSSAAMASEDVLREITLAADHRLAILPCRVEDVPPRGAFAYYLNPQHWLDAFSGPLSTHLGELVRAVRRSLEADTALVPESMEPIATVPPPPEEIVPDDWRSVRRQTRGWLSSLFRDR